MRIVIPVVGPAGDCPAGVGIAPAAVGVPPVLRLDKERTLCPPTPFSNLVLVVERYRRRIEDPWLPRLRRRQREGRRLRRSRSQPLGSHPPLGFDEPRTWRVDRGLCVRQPGWIERLRRFAEL